MKWMGDFVKTLEKQGFTYIYNDINITIVYNKEKLKMFHVKHFPKRECCGTIGIRS